MVRRVGAGRPRRRRRRRLRRLARGHRLEPGRLVGHLGRPRRRRASPASRTATGVTTPTAASDRASPIPWRRPPTCRRRPRRSSPTSTTTGATRVDGERGARQAPDAPVSIYEVHLGSWGRRRRRRQALPDLRRARRADRRPRPAPTASPTSSCCRSWSTRSTGRGATRPPATSRRPPATARRTDLMALVDHLHQRGVGVILDWVPSHFPMDAHGLARFDGTYLYEHADPRQGFHPDWGVGDLQLRPRRGALVPGVERDVAGSTATTSTGCGSTPSRRCSTSTTRASAGEWIPNATAAARTSRRSTSCASSTRRCSEEYPDMAPRRGVDGVADA